MTISHDALDLTIQGPRALPSADIWWLLEHVRSASKLIHPTGTLSCFESCNYGARDKTTT